MTTVKASELGLGDIIRLSGSEYSDATVYRTFPDGSCSVWRPYVHTDDTKYTGGVIPYIGLEDFTLPADASVTLMRRGPALR